LAQQVRGVGNEERVGEVAEADGRRGGSGGFGLRLVDRVLTDELLEEILRVAELVACPSGGRLLPLAVLGPPEPPLVVSRFAFRIVPTLIKMVPADDHRVSHFRPPRVDVLLTLPENVNKFALRLRTPRLALGSVSHYVEIKKATVSGDLVSG
jgi:hypothetical protein